ncbi:flagellar motor protein MotB [candidate division KSB1 bacterium]
MAKKKKEECPPVGSPGYMTTYGDMMTLLLTFFVLLLSFSSMREAKFRRAMGSLKGALGVLPQEESVIRSEEVPIPQLTNLQEEEISNTLAEMSDENVADVMQSIKLEFTDQGIAININDSLMFNQGMATLRPQIFHVLYTLAELAAGWPNNIRIVGHTDDTPISNEEFLSNWELSVHRALSVLHYFIDYCNVDPSKLSATGKGQFEPLFPNDAPLNKAKNRRVEIFIDYQKEDITSKKIEQFRNDVRKMLSERDKNWFNRNIEGEK